MAMQTLSTWPRQTSMGAPLADAFEPGGVE